MDCTVLVSNWIIVQAIFVKKFLSHQIAKNKTAAIIGESQELADFFSDAFNDWLSQWPSQNHQSKYEL